MEPMKLKVTCKELNGSVSKTEVTFEEDGDISFVSTSEGGKISASDIDSGDADSGKVLTADGAGGAAWE